MVTKKINNIVVAKGCLDGFCMICLVMVQILEKGTLSRGEGAAQGGEVLLDILSGGKWILWERSFLVKSVGWGKQCRINRKSEVIVDFRKDRRDDQPLPTMYFAIQIAFLYLFLCNFPEERFSNQFWSSVAFAYFILKVQFFYENGKQAYYRFFKLLAVNKSLSFL